MEKGGSPNSAYRPKYIIDTWTWVEYFKGTRKGRVAMDKIEIGENYTPTIVLFELKKWFTHKDLPDFGECLEFIKQKSVITNRISERIAVRAGEIQGKHRREGKKIPIVDCILMATAEHINKRATNNEQEIKIVTGDGHFKDFQWCEYIS